MEKNHWLRYVVAIFIIIVLALITYFAFQKSRPYAVLTPESYPEGTKVALYKQVPTNFPNEVLVEKKTLKYAGVLTNTSGKVDTNISYESDLTLDIAMSLYKTKLATLGWQVLDRSTNFKTGLLVAEKDTRNVMITFAPLKESKTLITFQYQQ